MMFTLYQSRALVRIMLGAATASPVCIMILASRHSTPATFFFFAIRMRKPTLRPEEKIEFGLKMLDFYSW